MNQKLRNNESSFKPILVAAALKSETKKLNIVKKNEKVVPLIEINKSDQNLNIEKMKGNELNVEENKSILVSTVNFQKMVDADTDFDFTSFVKSLSRKNTALPKYIRDNWTIVLSIRNQLETND